MMEVFGKRNITSRDFPLICFEPAKLILNFQPSEHVFTLQELQAHDNAVSDERLAAAWMKSTRELNLRAEQEPSFEWSSREWITTLGKHLELPASTIEKLCEDLPIHFHERVQVAVPHQVPDFLETLRERGYRLAIAANWQSSLQEVLRLFGLLDLFEIVLSSFEIGHPKPNPKILEAVLLDLDVEAKSSVLMGARYATDVAAARKIGMNAALYDPTTFELRALAPQESLEERVVSLETLRENRRLADTLLLSSWEQILEKFQA